MSTEPTPARCRRELARLLRELRSQHGLALEEVYQATAITAGFLSRVERGQRGLGDDNAKRLCDFYGVPPAVRTRITQLAYQGRQSSWWDKTELPRELKEYIGFEQSATAIMTYGSTIPVLLQTRQYATAMAARHVDLGDDGVVVDHWLRRQEVLDGLDPPWFHAVLDESVLHRHVGGVAVVRDQLVALHAAATRPRVMVQILPFSAGAHPGMDSRFIIVSTREDHTPDLVHTEGLSGFHNLEHPSRLAEFAGTWRTLSATALPPADSRNLIAATIGALERSR